MTGPAEPGPAGRKARDRSAALVAVGTALLMPPLVGVSLVDGTVVGMPVPFVYVSVVWAALIAAAAALARPLRHGATSAPTGNANDDAG